MTSPVSEMNLKIAQLLKEAQPSDIVDILTNPDEQGLLKADNNHNNGTNNNNPKKLAQ
ncbi:hypothetical protein [Kitasatospora sp. NPDC057541]|uniref:hypothetical protein n=1 Tax=unclassified Kitasatospora TaxID=2633591 RepID=UPI0036B2350D